MPFFRFDSDGYDNLGNPEWKEVSNFYRWTGSTWQKIQKIYRYKSDFYNTGFRWALVFEGTNAPQPKAPFSKLYVNDANLSETEYFSGDTIRLTRGDWTQKPTSYRLRIQYSQTANSGYTTVTGGDKTLNTTSTPTAANSTSNTFISYQISASDALHPSYYFKGLVQATNADGTTPLETAAILSKLRLIVNNPTISNSLSTGNRINWSGYIQGDTTEGQINISDDAYIYSQTVEIRDKTVGSSTFGQVVAGPYSVNAGTLFYDLNFTTAGLAAGKNYDAKVTITAYDSWFLTATPNQKIVYSPEFEYSARPSGTPGSVTFSRDSSTSYVYSITSNGTWTNSPTSYRYQWYTYEDGTYFPISGATSSTFNAINYKLIRIIPVVWASNAFGESNLGYSLVRNSGTNVESSLGSITAAASALVQYKAPVISSFTVTPGSNQITYNYAYTNDDPSVSASISVSPTATGFPFTPGASGSTKAISSGTYTFTLTVTNSSINGGSFAATATANAEVGQKPVNTVAPSITGSSRTFSVSGNGTWDPADSDGVYQYQWRVNEGGQIGYINLGASNTAEGSSTGSTVTLTTNAYDGVNILCRVTATNSFGSTDADSNSLTITAPTFTYYKGQSTCDVNNTGCYATNEAPYYTGVSAEYTEANVPADSTTGPLGARVKVVWRKTTAEAISAAAQPACVICTTTTTTTTTAPPSNTYYKGSSTCNANDGCYSVAPYYTGETATYTSLTVPADSTTGATNARVKVVWRLSSADAITAAAQAACVVCTTTTTTTTTTTAAPSNTYYKGSSTCNANDGCYSVAPYYTGETATYTSLTVPADSTTGATNARVKVVWRLSSADAVTAAAQAACVVCTTTTTTTTTTTAAPSNTYYQGSSTCNANSGCYIVNPYYTGTSATYTSATVPADSTTGTSNNRVKVVWRLSTADAISAAAQASCVSCTTTTAATTTTTTAGTTAGTTTTTTAGTTTTTTAATTTTTTAATTTTTTAATTTTTTAGTTTTTTAAPCPPLSATRLCTSANILAGCCRFPGNPNCGGSGSTSTNC